MSDTTTFRSILGADTFVIVEFDYRPKARSTRDHPGRDADADITRVYVDADGCREDDIAADLAETYLEKLKVEALEWIRDNSEPPD